MSTPDFTDGPQVLGAAPLALAALWFAVEDERIMGEAQMLSPWRWAELALPDAVKEAQKAYEASLVRAIEAGKLKPRRERFTSIGDTLDTDRTLLDLDGLQAWRLARGLRHSATIIAVQNEERLAHLAAMDAIKATRNRATVDPLAQIETANLAASMGIAEIAGLLREVKHLKAKQATDADTIRELKRELRARPEPENLRTSALLLIGRLKEIYIEGGRNRNQTSLVTELLEGDKKVRGLLDTTLKKLFAEANKALKEARKQ